MKLSVGTCYKNCTLSNYTVYMAISDNRAIYIGYVYNGRFIPDVDDNQYCLGGIWAEWTLENRAGLL